MPCYRCGVRQTDPERGKSPWRRGVRHDQLVLVCPACQAGDWAADLQCCARCGTVHLIRRLGQVECLDGGLVHEPGPVLVPVPAGGTDGGPPGRPAGEAAAGSARFSSGSRAPGTHRDDALATEVGRALDRILGRR